MQKEHNFEVEFLDKTYKIFKYAHIDHYREGQTITRGAEIGDEGYVNIIKEAFKCGLTSHRNKKLVIVFFNHENIRMSILTEFIEDEIHMISVLKSRRNDDWKNTYITVQNRLNMFHYVLPERGEPGNKSFLKPIKVIREKTKTWKSIRKVK